VERGLYATGFPSILTPKLEAAKRSLAEAAVAADVWAKYALMFANKLLITVGTLGHMYFVVKHEKCLQQTRQRDVWPGGVMVRALACDFIKDAGSTSGRSAFT